MPEIRSMRTNSRAGPLRGVLPRERPGLTQMSGFLPRGPRGPTVPYILRRAGFRIRRLRCSFLPRRGTRIPWPSNDIPQRVRTRLRFPSRTPRNANTDRPRTSRIPRHARRMPLLSFVPQHGNTSRTRWSRVPRQRSIRSAQSRKFRRQRSFSRSCVLVLQERGCSCCRRKNRPPPSSLELRLWY